MRIEVRTSVYARRGILLSGRLVEGEASTASSSPAAFLSSLVRLDALDPD